jgi:ABC-type glycerol-3-phosphate transport system permease component
MDTIPRSIDESSLIDGASHRKTFFYILFPLLKPVIAATVVFVFVFCWNEFYLDFVLTATSNARTIPVALFSFQSSYDIDWNLLCSASILALLPIVIIFLAMQKHFIAGLTHGAIKG